MSLLCSCISKKGHYSPTHTTSKKMSSKLRQPAATGTSGSRFGFGAKSHKNSVPVRQSPTALELKPVTKTSSHVASVYTEPVLTGGLALDPSALLLARSNDGLGGYVVRDKQTNDKPRPMSSIAALGQSSQEQDSGFSSFDDTRRPSKPKSGLRSLFSRSVKENPAAKKPSHVSNSNLNNSRSDGSLGGLPKFNPRGSIGSTGSSGSNHSTDSRTKLGFKRNSMAPSRATNDSHALTNHTDQKVIKPSQKASQCRLTTTTASSTPSSSLPKSSSSGVLKYSSQTKSKLSKSSKLSHPENKHSTCPVTKDQCLPNQYYGDTKQLHNNNVSADQCKGTNIDPVCCNTIEDASAPVATADTDSETSFTIAEVSPQCTTANGLISSRSTRSMSTGSGTSDKKKPTIEINPLTKEDNPDPAESKIKQSEKMGVHDMKTMSNSSPRSYTIDEEVLSSIISEVTSLKNTVVELQHHLIGKQEHEEKMREELKMKNEIINNLQNELAFGKM